jgi:hypothetical protein
MPRSLRSPVRQPARPPAYRGLLVVLLCCLAVGALVGCGNGLYALRINSASGRFEEARTIGAEQEAPYEYYAAEVRLEEARRQAARAEYGTAANLAHEAERYAAKAITKTRNAKAGGAP